MKRAFLLLILAVFLAASPPALAQLSSENKITFREGETLKVGVKITGLSDVSRAGATVRDLGSPSKIIKSWTTADGTMTKIGDSLYVFGFNSLESIGKAGPGKWQFEIQSATVGVRKTDIFPFEIYRATSLTGGTTPVLPGGYNYLFDFNFSALQPVFDVISAGLTIVDGQSISTALSLKVDKVAGKALSTNDFTNAYKGQLDNLSSNLALKLNVADTTALLRKTTAAGLYVARVAGQSLITDAERTKLQGIATGATANSTDAQLRDRTTHTGVQSISTVSGLQTALDAKQDVSTLAAGVRGTVLTGLDVTRTGPVTSADNVVQAIGELQNQATANTNNINTKPTLYNFNTYALAASGMIGVTGRHIVYVVADEVNNGGQEGWYVWNGSTLKEILVL